MSDVLQAKPDGYLIVDGIQGWCDYTFFYDRLAAAIPNSTLFCEVGVWLGSSAIYMAKRLKALEKLGVQITCVDTWEGGPEHAEIIAGHGGPDGLFKAFVANVEAAGVADQIAITKCKSVLAANLYEDHTFWAVFIDADHTEDAVAADLRAWWTKVAPGGVLAGHDWDFGSVHNAVTAFAESRRLTVNHENRVWWIGDL